MLSSVRKIVCDGAAALAGNRDGAIGLLQQKKRRTIDSKTNDR